MDSLKYGKIYAYYIHRTGWYLVLVSDEASDFPFTHLTVCIQSVWMGSGNGNLLLILSIPRGFSQGYFIHICTRAYWVLLIFRDQTQIIDQAIKLERKEMRSCFIWGNKSRSFAKESYLFCFLSRGLCLSIFYPHIELIENGSSSTIFKTNKESRGEASVYKRRKQEDLERSVI